MTQRLAPRCILLDLDGTLLDTAPDLHAALNRALTDQGFEPVSLMAAKPWVSHGAPGLVRFGLGGSDQHPGYDRVLDRMIQYYGRDLAVHSSLFEGMDKVLHEIEALGLVWGVVTNKRSHFSEALLRSFQLFDRAACIISGDSTANKKPHPEPLLEACRRIDVRPAECIYIGDAAKDIQAGNAAGMTTLAAAYGYLGDEDDVTDWGAVGLLHHPLDLLRWVCPS
ncbi:MAG: HAD-IA family hydrolase [Methylococcaceae bacterium]|nr:HAD-IA family hydrolase [Methylococcaceae bacterium]